MERIAFISDIHGNLEALKATLDDIKSRDVDYIVCLGDIILKGSHSSECLQLVKDNCDLVIQGNYEEGLGSVYSSDGFTEEEINYVNNLPFSYDFYISGRRVRLFHSTPTNSFEYVSPFDDKKLVRELFLPSCKTEDGLPDVVVCGHIHVPFNIRMYNRTLIGIGSVGESVELASNPDFNGDPRETTCSNYVIMTGNLHEKDIFTSISIEHIKVPYDIEKELIDNRDEKREKCLKLGIYPSKERVNKFYQEKRGINLED